MNFKDFLNENKENLLEEWFLWLIDHYPEPSKKFISKKEEPFTNPVGYNFYQNLGKLFSLLCSNEIDCTEFNDSLEDILKIRAVQDLSYWQSANIFRFLWDKFNNSLPTDTKVESYRTDVDYYMTISEKAFESFINIREKIAQIQREEIRNRYGKFLEKLNEKYKLMDNILGESFANKIEE